MKALTEEQRKRLEIIARDEFDMRQNEIVEANNKAINDWKIKQQEAFAKSALWKRFLRNEQEKARIADELAKSGFSQQWLRNDINGYGTIKAQFVPMINPNSKNFQDERKKYQFDHNAFNRARNQVLAAIWSMNKEFDECITMIKDTVKKLS